MRKRIKIRITTNEKDFLKYVSRHTYIGHEKFGKNLVVIHEKKELLTLNKPIYVGNTVLELSKLAMYKFYYDFVKKNVKSLYYCLLTQTVFALKLKKIFYKKMLEHKELFDLSNFPKYSEYFCNDNKKYQEKWKMNIEEK